MSAAQAYLACRAHYDRGLYVTFTATELAELANASLATGNWRNGMSVCPSRWHALLYDIEDTIFCRIHGC